MEEPKSPYYILTLLFPKQFRSIPSTIIWTIVFLLDAAVVFWAAHLLGFQILNTGSWATPAVCLLIAFGLFCLESFLYNRITQ